MKEKIVKGRKEYTCNKCGKMIGKGEEHIVRKKLREHIKCSTSDVYYVIGFFIATLIFLGTVMK
tara:strand:+ start:1450 stop:1641 length:192 start_codon:yes stop_codon:yes gene_type:complete